MKATFQKGAERTKWLAEIVSHPFFDEAVTHAFAEYASHLGATLGDDKKCQGAIQALHTLKTLSDIPKPSVNRSMNHLVEPKY